MVAPAGPTLSPCLSTLLHTCICPSSLVLRVEHVSGKAQSGSRGNAILDAQNPAQDRTGADDGDSDSELSGKEQDPPQIRQQSSPCRRSSLHLVLSDGHIQLQALLAPHLFAREPLADLQIKDILKVTKFQVRATQRLNGQGSVVYLGIQDCELVSAEEKNHWELKEGGFIRDADNEMSPKKLSQDKQQTMRAEYRSWSKKRERRQEEGTAARSTSPHKKLHIFQEDDSEDEEGFDTLTVSPSQAETRRRTLRRMQEGRGPDRKPTDQQGLLGKYSQAQTQEGPVAFSSPLRTSASNEAGGVAQAAEDNSSKSTKNTVADPDLRNLTDGTPSSLHHRHESQPAALPPPDTAHLPVEPTPTEQNLASLLAIRPQKSYHCPPIFALISWISPSLIHRPNTPFPPKRHLKIHDPSISTRHSGLTVAVFADATHFLPKVGTVALFRGMIMNWVRSGEDVIMNRYPLKVGSQIDASAKAHTNDEEGDEWFISDRQQLINMGYDVQSMESWWVERSVTKKEKTT